MGNRYMLSHYYSNEAAINMIPLLCCDLKIERKQEERFLYNPSLDQ